jgi:hypothetical protein
MSQYDDTPPVSGWAVGGLVFAGAILVLLGIFEAISGLNAIFEDEFYVVTENYLFDLDVTVWGWIHLILGLAVAFTGGSLLARKAWAGAVAIVLAMISALANFFVIPYYPWWSLLMIGLAVWVVWSLTRPGAVQLRE